MGSQPCSSSGRKRRTVRSAWVSLDRFDDDPSVLLTLLASAYARIAPDTIDLTADMRGVGVSALGRAAPRLASVFRASPVPFVLMLDDFHELQSAGVSRRDGSGDLGDPSRFATGRGESFRAAASAATAGFG